MSTEQITSNRSISQIRTSLSQFELRISIFVFLLSVTIAIAAGWRIEATSGQPENREIFIAILGVVTGVAVNVATGALVFFLYRHLKDSLSKTESEADLSKIVRREVGELLWSKQSIRSINYVSHSYHNIAWRDLLDGADEVALCAAYWSSEWIGANVERLCAEAALRKVEVYLCFPLTYRSHFGGTAAHDYETRRRIMRAAIKISDIAQNHQELKVRFLRRIPPYMLCAIHKSDFTNYLISPYSMNTVDRMGRSPIVGFSSRDSSQEIASFFQNELKQLEDFEEFPASLVNQLTWWSGDASRVVVSVGEKCSLGCRFCYVPSIRSGKPPMILASTDQELLGSALYHSVINSSKFAPGLGGTRFLIGGLTEPFLPKNQKALDAFLTDLVESKATNLVHIATRSPDLPQIRTLDLLSKVDNLAVSISVSSFDTGKFEKANLVKRLATFTSLASDGFRLSIYLRPIIPGITLSEIDKLLDCFEQSKIRDIVIGNLYVDSQIKKTLHKQGVDMSGRTSHDSRLIVDNEGLLTKLEQDPTRQSIRDALVERDFKPYDDLSEYFSEIAKTPIVR